MGGLRTPRRRARARPAARGVYRDTSSGRRRSRLDRDHRDEHHVDDEARAVDVRSALSSTRLRGSDRACATARATQRSSCGLPRMPSSSIRSQPCIARPRISNGCANGFASSASVSSGLDAQQQPAAPAHRHRHVAVDQEREPAEHALFADAVLAQDQLANPIGEILVVGHAALFSQCSPRRRRRGRLDVPVAVARAAVVVAVSVAAAASAGCRRWIPAGWLSRAAPWASCAPVRACSSWPAAASQSSLGLRRAAAAAPDAGARTMNVVPARAPPGTTSTCTRWRPGREIVEGQRARTRAREAMVEDVVEMRRRPAGAPLSATWTVTVEPVCAPACGESTLRCTAGTARRRRARPGRRPRPASRSSCCSRSHRRSRRSRARARGSANGPILRALRVMCVLLGGSLGAVQQGRRPPQRSGPCD